MRLLIVRHGETEANLGLVIQGHSPNSLSARGKQQAIKLGERLQGELIDAAYSSDLVRARETAEIISSVSGISIKYRSELRERCYGIFQSRPVAEYELALSTSGLARQSFAPDQGESLRDLEARVLSFLETILSMHANETVLVVAHAGPNRTLLKLLLNKSYDEWLTIEQDNACFNAIEISSGHIDPLVLNCTAHLVAVGVSPLGVHE